MEGKERLCRDGQGGRRGNTKGREEREQKTKNKDYKEREEES